MIETSVLVVGAGAIGGVTAAKMTGEVRRVVVLDANREHVEGMRGEGLLIDDLGEERRVPLDAHADTSCFDAPFDFVLITLKAPHLQRQSKLLNHGTVSAVLEEPRRILGTESRDRLSYCLEEGLSSTGLGFA